MDIDIQRWISEYILWQPLEDTLLNTLIGVFPLPNDDVRIKRVLILHKIEFEISNGSVSEKILKLLELMEEVYRQEGIEASEALKAAYCAVAVDCTVKFLNNKGEESGKLKYLEAVKRIWKQRINKMEEAEKVGVVSDELWKWRDEIEAALWEVKCCDNVVMRSKNIAAVDAVKVFVKEAKERIGPPFLELMAETLMHDDAQACLGRENTEKYGADQDLTCSNHDRADDEMAETLRHDDAQACLGRENTEKYGADQDLTCSNHDRVDDEMADTLRHDDAQACLGRENTEKSGADMDLTETNKGNALLRRKHVAVKRTRGSSAGVSRGVDFAETGIDTSCEQDDLLPTPIIEEAREALKLSSLELRAVVKDPLPEALEFAESLISLGRDDSSQQPVENDNRIAPHIVVNNNGVVQANGENKDDQHNSHHDAASKPSLMTRNSTAHTFEWDDSIDDLSEGSPSRGRGLALPTPRSLKVSPLKKYAFKKVPTRRKPKRWSMLEEDTLRSGVQKFGVGKWTLIFDTYRGIFEDRTPVDLKDKWRNLTS